MEADVVPVCVTDFVPDGVTDVDAVFVGLAEVEPVPVAEGVPPVAERVGEVDPEREPETVRDTDAVAVKLTECEGVLMLRLTEMVKDGEP